MKEIWLDQSGSVSSNHTGPKRAKKMNEFRLGRAKNGLRAIKDDEERLKNNTFSYANSYG